LLALSAAAKPGILTIGHVVHDMRPAAEARADRDATRELADALGIPFVESAVSVKEVTGNVEGTARQLRYASLGRLAQEAGVQFIATGHQAGDQLETIVMGLLRGSGPGGLRGVAKRRRLHIATGGVGGDRPVWIIRPLLETPREECRRICSECGWAWREDGTNADTTRLRARLRHGIINQLIDLCPGAERRAAAAADLLRDATGLIEDRTDRLLARAAGASGSTGEYSLSWDRDSLRTERAIVVGSVLRRGAAHLCGGDGLDRLSYSTIARVAGAVRDERREPRLYDWRGVEVLVTAGKVEVRRKDQP
jgi:tRNA(Ile)-lysidine synthase